MSELQMKKMKKRNYHLGDLSSKLNKKEEKWADRDEMLSIYVCAKSSGPTQNLHLRFVQSQCSHSWCLSLSQL